mmetsp:Transcript_952/g.1600  ORF Transcript_952/g.1600 Transcript_952/m.1600 type:complete len:204 (-) Transcript_952:843-1454(-)
MFPGLFFESRCANAHHAGESPLDLVHHFVSRLRWCILSDPTRFEELVPAVVCEVLSDSLLRPEKAAAVEFSESHAPLHVPLVYHPGQLRLTRPAPEPANERRAARVHQICQEFDVRPLIFVLHPHLHIRLDNDGKDEVLEDEEDDEEVEHRVNSEIDALCPIIRKFTEEHHEIGLKGRLKGLEVCPLRSEPPCPHPSKAAHEK